MKIVASVRGGAFATLLGLILAVALAAGGGHRTAPSAPDAALAAFLSAGGTLADLCLDSGGHGPGDGMRHCDACQPTLAGPPPAPVRIAARAVARPVRSIRAARSPGRVRPARRAWAPRAPPAR